MGGTTKGDLQVFLDQLVNWANHVQNHGQKLDAFASLGNGAEVAADSPIWDLLKTASKDKVFGTFLASCGLTVAAAPTDSTNIEFQEFLQNLSQSMVRTQQKLDIASANYIAAAARQPHIQPSVFRIPKLSAQMRFALEIQNGKTLNLLFYKQDEKTTSRNEQTIDFDIVTAPAPPGASQLVAKLAPRLDLVLDPFERKQVIEAIRAADARDAAGANVHDPKGQLFGPILQAAAGSISPDLVILAAESDQAAPGYLVFLATDDNDHSIGLWKVTIPAGGTAALQVISRFNRNNGPEEGVLQDVILAVTAKQKIYFSD